MSDAPLTDCPACGAPAFKKQLTAAGFQLKGSGWYVTDFRGGSGGATAVPPVSGNDAPPAPAADSKPAEPAAKAAAPAPAAAAAPASTTSTTKAS